MMDDDDDLFGAGGDRRGDGWGWSEVGYGRPPKDRQFKPGQSGNPRGRPRGAKTRRLGGGGSFLRDPLLAEIERMIPVREAGQEVLMPQIQAVIRQMSIKAMQGNVRAAELLLKYLAQIQRAEQRQNELFLDAMAHYKAEASAEVKRRLDRGVTDMSDILPHPDHIDVDLATGEILVSGPMTVRERDAVEAGHAHLRLLQQAVEALDGLPTKGLSAKARQQRAEARRHIEGQIRDYEAALGVDEP